MKKIRIVHYKAVKVIFKPVKVDFYTKKDKKVSFKGYKGYEVVIDPSKLKTSDLIRWLRLNKYEELAKILKTVVNKAKKEVNKL